MAKVQFATRGMLVQARLTMPDGRCYSAVVNARPDNPELGASWFKKAARKVGRGVVAPVKLAHKITHKGPIGALEKKVQKVVGNALPFTKPFIKIHNSV